MSAAQIVTYPHARWHVTPHTSVRFSDGFWTHYQSLNQQVTIPHGYRMLEDSGTLDNLRIAAGRKQGKYRGAYVFLDSDVYKWLEAVGYELARAPDAALQRLADSVVELVAAAQQPDGYLNSYYQIAEPAGRWSDFDFGHELYCAGHLFQAAVAYTRGTGTTALLGVATRFADLLVRTFGPEARRNAPGHPEVEMALVELFRLTGNRSYLDLARFFIDERGKGVMRGMRWLKSEYHQDRVPVRQAEIIEGHAVRAMYLNAGVADLYLETGEAALMESLERQWQDMVGRKMFLTGGIGSRYEGEAFGDPYELPPDICYCETCAAIGSVLWNFRMLLATGDGRYADVMERALYNGVLSGLALDGAHFFYMNPLLSHGGYQRLPWYDCACCPPNLMRLLASLGQYALTTDANGVQAHLYDTATAAVEFGGRKAVVSMKTDYPWTGDVALTIEQTDGAPWTLRLRRPSWCPRAAVRVNGQPVAAQEHAGYLMLERAWQPGDTVGLTLAMEPALVEPHPRVDAVRDCLAIERGPLVYCLEAFDHPDVDLLDIRIDERAPLRAQPHPEGDGPHLMIVETTGYLQHADEGAGLYRRATGQGAGSLTPIHVTAIPYYAWGNRGGNAMRVWVPRARQS